MNNSLDRLFGGIVASLSSEVIPRLQDEFARGQAYAAIDLLNNLRPRIDWAAPPLAAQIAAQTAAAGAVDALAQNLAARPPVMPAELAAPPEAASGEDLRQLRDRLDEHLCRVLDWLGKRHQAVPAGAIAAINGVVTQYMKEQVRREVSLAARPLFGEIAGNAGAAKPSATARESLNLCHPERSEESGQSDPSLRSG